jgi:hypothetical protein
VKRITLSAATALMLAASAAAFAGIQGSGLDVLQQLVLLFA